MGRATLAAAVVVLALTSCSSKVEPGRAAPDPCGAPVPRAGGGTWTCTFADDFGGTSVDPAKWVKLTTQASGFTNGGECYVDGPDNIAVADGTLRLTARQEPAPISCPGLPTGSTTSYTGASVTSVGRFAQAYGRFEIRARFPAAQDAGLHSALWLWPVNDTRYGAEPASGEVDIAEFYTSSPDRVIPYVHYANPADTTVTNNECMVDHPDRFHVYTLEWTPLALEISIDGRQCVVNNWQPVGMAKPAPFDQPFFLNLTQAIGTGANGVTPGTELPGTTQVDYVRVWR
jgi:beta-glucanase (GH16 family)